MPPSQNDKKSDDQGSLTPPLHRRIAESLTQQVTSGKLKPGQKLPSERRIAYQFSASRATVRTALQHLEQEGLINRRDRRSAVVSLRRKVTPSIRIACTSHRILNLLRRLSDMQLLPPRSQLHQVDISEKNVMDNWITHPASGADVLLTDLAMFHSLTVSREHLFTLPATLMKDMGIIEPLAKQFSDDGRAMAFPISISPVLIYRNQALLRQHQIHADSAWNSWDEIFSIAQTCTSPFRFGLQMRPVLQQFSCFLLHRGIVPYQKGKIDRQMPSSFEEVLRFIYSLIHEKKICPPLTADSADLFSQKRCALAMDSFEQYFSYHEKIGPDLDLISLPPSNSHGSMYYGLIAMALSGTDTPQPVEDFLRGLLNPRTQQLLCKYGAGLPVRQEQLHTSWLQSIGLSEPVASLLIQQCRNFQLPPMPDSLEQILKIQQWLEELWLGLQDPQVIAQNFRQMH